MLAAVEDVDAVLAVDRDGGDVGEPPSRRQLCPVFHNAVAVFARAENGAHVSLLFFSRHSEACAARAMMCNCTSENPYSQWWLWIPGLRLSVHLRCAIAHRRMTWMNFPATAASGFAASASRGKNPSSIALIFSASC